MTARSAHDLCKKKRRLREQAAFLYWKESARSVISFLFEDLEREHQIQQLLRVVEIGVQDRVDLVEPVEER